MNPSFILLVGYQCERLSLGSFERGPVHLVWDAHGGADPPPRCLENETLPTHAAILNVLLVDDQELVAHFQAEYGVPARYAEFTVDEQSAGSLTERTWSWVADGSTSSFTFLDDGTNSPDPISDRLFWARGSGGLGQLDLTYERNGLTITTRSGHGPMQTPMLMAETPQQYLIAFTQYYTSMAGTGHFRIYSDQLCEQLER